MFYQNPIFWGALVLFGLAVGYFIREIIAAKGASSLERKLKSQLEEAKRQSQEVILEGRTKAASLIEEVKNEERSRKEHLDKFEERLIKKEEQLDRQKGDLDSNQKKIEEERQQILLAEGKIAEVREEAKKRLEELSGISGEEAKKRLIEEITSRHRDELAQTLQKLDRERMGEIEKKSFEIMTTAIQRYARSHVSELTTTNFPLPSEEIKGKIIGREGRNIRAFERASGVELIMDETPDSITISSFDPLRREIARVSLEKLLKDGRIQPAKIEEKIEESKQELNKRMAEIGEAAAFELNIYDLPKEIMQLLGRLHFRTSYGQNVLTHSVEMTYITGMMAAELGADVEVAKRGALLHDIGKAISHEVEGTHVELGRKILKKYDVDERVIRAMESHHEEYPFSTPESFIVTAADALSAARPGARRDTLENYVKRLRDLEKIAGEFEGVKNAYAIAAGRELRVFVMPEKIDDFSALQLARDIASRIQSELKYPGEIKVNVIREMRAVEYAK